MFYFSADSVGTGPGYDIVIRQLPCGDQDRSATNKPPFPPIDGPVNDGRGPINGRNCDRATRDLTSDITSPGYPGDYPSRSRCVTTVERYASDICRLRIQFLSFDLEPTSDCRNDFLHITGTGERLCGRELTEHEKSEFQWNVT